MNNWYKLDNAAKIFPAVSKLSNTSIYRISVLLKEPVKPEALQAAVDIVIKRFPVLAANIHKGAFWNFFDFNENPLLIREEEEYPCAPIKAKQNGGYLLRVLYYNCRISVEIFHALTDGSGAIEFLKTLTFAYFNELGIQLDSEGVLLLPEEAPSKYELEDSFNKHYRPVTISKRRRPKAFRIEGTTFEPFGNQVIHGVICASKLNEIARKNGVTITTYLTGVLIYSIYSEAMRYGVYYEPITISIPVNLRKIFPSKSLRNFFSVSNISMRMSDTVTFEQILAEVSQQLKKEAQKERLEESIAENVQMEKNLMVKFVPLFIKSLVLKYEYTRRGENLKSMTLSNIGNIALPSGMRPLIERMEVVLYPTIKSPINCGICSVNDKLTITFTKNIVESDIIRCFFQFLSGTGLDVEVYSNEWGKRQK